MGVRRASPEQARQARQAQQAQGGAEVASSSGGKTGRVSAPLLAQAVHQPKLSGQSRLKSFGKAFGATLGALAISPLLLIGALFTGGMAVTLPAIGIGKLYCEAFTGSKLDWSMG
jgi:hypothetical protein